MASFEGIYWALPQILPRAKREHLADVAAGVLPISLGAYECAEWCLSHLNPHEEATALLRELHAVGIELSVTADENGSDDLAARDPRKALTPALRERLTAHEADLIALLRIGPVAEMTWREFARSGRIARFLTAGGEVFVVAADNASYSVEETPGGGTGSEPVFTASALRHRIASIHGRRSA